MVSTRFKTIRLTPGVKINGEAIRKWMDLFDRAVAASEPQLTDLDRAIGDGDHGVNIHRGSRAVVARLNEIAPPDLPGHFRTISSTLTSSVGGASGPLYGAFFLHASRSALYRSELSLADLTVITEAGCQGVVQLGKAAVGDKTMVDTLQAAVMALRAACHRRESLPDAMAACTRATRDAVQRTKPMIARKGRASYLGERSVGFQDPGATSAHLLFESLARALSNSSSTSD
jgi:dihydroxyacetone kinase-like protein